MADEILTDPFVSTEEEVEVDAETAAAIELGITQADEGRTVPLEDVRKMIPEWISKFESRKDLPDTKIDFDNPVPLPDEEDEETLAAIDRAIKSADEGRVVPSEEARRRVREWLAKSSTQKKL